MTLSPLPSSIHRALSRLLAASSLTHLTLILTAFVSLRVFLSLRDGMVMEGDGVPEMGRALGRLWMGDLTVDQFLAQGATSEFLKQRSSQLLYPLFVSLYSLVGLDIVTHVLVLNTVLGSILIIASYFTGLRLHGKGYACLVALLMCSLTALYWIARYTIVDNVFYAMIPLTALAVLKWRRERTAASATLLTFALGALVLTRPESLLVVLSVILVIVWHRARRSVSRLTALALLLLSLAIASVGAAALIGASPSFQRVLLSRGHVAWGLAGSAFTLRNSGGAEFDALLARYPDGQYPNLDDLHYQMSLDAISAIRDHPFRYALNVPLRGLAIMFPWTYQPWSRPHILYEALYTIFVTTGLLLLLRRGNLGMPLVLVVVIPLSIWLFLSAYQIDNDLKHRNGILVGLNLIAPLGYFLRHDRGVRSSRGHERLG